MIDKEELYNAGYLTDNQYKNGSKSLLQNRAKVYQEQKKSEPLREQN